MILIEITKDIDLTPNGQDIITALFVAFLAAVGWLIVEQIRTNKELSRTITNAVLEFKDAIQEFNTRDKLQQQTCDFHRRRTDDLKTEFEAHKKHIDAELRKMHTEITTIKTRQ